MTDRLRIALAQLNPTVGDVEGNLARIRAARARAAGQGADLVVYAELVLSGYPPEDLVRRPAFLADIVAAVHALAGDTADDGPAMLIGTPWPKGDHLYNACLLLEGGQIAAFRYKHDLPNYGVFDEKRVFAAGPLPGPIAFRGVRLGAMVCEDMWQADVTECLDETGAQILVVINGSPFERDKNLRRLNLAISRITETGLPLIYVNQVGGQDELVFDGASFVLAADGGLRVQMPAWVEDVVTTEWHLEADRWVCAPGPRALLPEGEESLYAAMRVGLEDYIGKNRFPGVVLGLSGGIDSALTAAVAVDALGPDKVHCVMLPSRFTSRDSLEDAEACAKALGVRYDTIPIAPAVGAFDAMLAPLFAGMDPGLAEENIQARIRGLTLMALSNKFGPLLMTTGNKSEVAVGYATLYGDMAGGYSVLKDIYKTTVFALSRWRNANLPEGARGPAGEVIPERIITKPPTAELRENQKDEDSLPPYAELDDILDCLIERDLGIEDIIARGHTRETVKRIEHLVYVAEYKRRQAAPGVKVGSKLFGRDRRYPITNGFRDAN